MMRAAVVGGGPVGMVTAMGLARAGHDVVLVDRDAGPPESGEWDRRGVMQFRLPHMFRPAVRQVLEEHTPGVWEALVAAGGIPARMPGMPEHVSGLHSRRSTFERVVWQMARGEQRLTVARGHADAVASTGVRVSGVVVDGRLVEADLVVSAGGRATRFAREVVPAAEAVPTGFAYAARQYRALPGTDLPEAGGTPIRAEQNGYLALVFRQDDDTISALVVRAADDSALAELRRPAAFAAAAAAIPTLRAWTDPDCFEPITDVMAGSGLDNAYRRQVDGSGRAPLAGLVLVGDAVCTTNPAAGRGVALGLRQASRLLHLLAQPPSDLRDVTESLDAWCEESIRPWFEDHVWWDRTLLARWRGQDVDLEGRLPSDLVCAAAEVDASIRPAVGAYLAMAAGPSVLEPAVERARAVLRTGWRPTSTGPTRDELAESLLAATA